MLIWRLAGLRPSRLPSAIQSEGQRGGSPWRADSAGTDRSRGRPDVGPHRDAVLLRFVRTPGATGCRLRDDRYHQYPAHAAFGGYKVSGVGRENHQMMLEHYSQTKCLLVSYDPEPLGFF